MQLWRFRELTSFAIVQKISRKDPVAFGGHKLSYCWFVWCFFSFDKYSGEQKQFGETAIFLYLVKTSNYLRFSVFLKKWDFFYNGALSVLHNLREFCLHFLKSLRFVQFYHMNYLRFCIVIEIWFVYTTLVVVWFLVNP